MTELSQPPLRQLEMCFPGQLLDQLTPPEIPDGVVMRTFRAGDEADYLRLMAAAGFCWQPEFVAEVRTAALPDGIHFLIEKTTGRFMATALAKSTPPAGHTSGGELGWVAVDPAFRGRSLGKVVCNCVLDRFRRAGYREVYLLTDDFRHAALATYLHMGWRPIRSDRDMAKRWQAIERELGIPDHAETPFDHA